MKISVRNFNKYQIFDLEGPIGVDDADRIEAFIYENISRESNKTVINRLNVSDVVLMIISKSFLESVKSIYEAMEMFNSIISGDNRLSISGCTWL